jgi:hypothetical protein
MFFVLVVIFLAIHGYVNAEENGDANVHVETEQISDIDESISSWQVPATDELTALLEQYTFEQKEEVRRALNNIKEKFKEEVDRLRRDFQTYEKRQQIEDLSNAVTKIQNLVDDLRLVNVDNWEDYLRDLHQTIQKIL